MDKRLVLDNDFFLQDRIQKIQQIISQYGEDNFYISFSGGKDSTVLSELVDMAIPSNNIPRVYANTGIEYEMVKAFVAKKAEKDKRIVMLKPAKPITETLRKYGYPFKSKNHSYFLDIFQRNGKLHGVKNYLGEGDKNWSRTCPKILRYQFTDKMTIKISDKCCAELKEKPMIEWAKEHNKPYAITGMMHEEGGRRKNAQCLSFRGGELRLFNPMVAITKEWEAWFIGKYNVDICGIYKPPYNFRRTGCKGCPFAVELQKELETMQKYFPNERKQCEIIWKPVYEEYRKIGYRLKTVETLELFDNKDE